MSLPDLFCSSISHAKSSRLGASTGKSTSLSISAFISVLSFGSLVLSPGINSPAMASLFARKVGGLSVSVALAFSVGHFFAVTLGVLLSFISLDILSNRLSSLVIINFSQSTTSLSVSFPLTVSLSREVPALALGCSCSSLLLSLMFYVITVSILSIFCVVMVSCLSSVSVWLLFRDTLFVVLACPSVLGSIAWLLSDGFIMFSVFSV